MHRGMPRWRSASLQAPESFPRSKLVTRWWFKTSPPPTSLANGLGRESLLKPSHTTATWCACTAVALPPRGTAGSCEKSRLLLHFSPLSPVLCPPWARLLVAARHPPQHLLWHPLHHPLQLLCRQQPLQVLPRCLPPSHQWPLQALPSSPLLLIIATTLLPHLAPTPSPSCARWSPVAITLPSTTSTSSPSVAPPADLHMVSCWSL